MSARDCSDEVNQILNALFTGEEAAGVRRELASIAATHHSDLRGIIRASLRIILLLEQQGMLPGEEGLEDGVLTAITGLQILHGRTLGLLAMADHTMRETQALVSLLRERTEKVRARQEVL